MQDPVKPFSLKSYETDLNNWERVKGQWEHLNQQVAFAPINSSDKALRQAKLAQLKVDAPIHEAQKKGWDSVKSQLSGYVNDYLKGFSDEKLYTKDALGFKVPNSEYITEIAGDLFSKSGVKTNAVKSHLENEIRNQLDFKLKQPELEKRLAPEKAKLEAKIQKEGASSLLTPELKSKVDKDFASINTSFIQDNKTLKKSIEGQLNEAVQPVKVEYDNVKQKYSELYKELTQQVQSKSQQELDASLRAKLDELQQSVKEGRIGIHKAKADYAAFEDEAVTAYEQNFDKTVSETFEQQYGKQFRDEIEPLKGQITEYQKFFQNRLGKALASNFKDYETRTKKLNEQYAPIIGKAYTKKLSEKQVEILGELFKEDEAKRKEATDAIYEGLGNMPFGSYAKGGLALLTSGGKALGEMLSSFGRISRQVGLDKLPNPILEAATGQSVTDMAIGKGEGMATKYNLPAEDITWSNFFTPRVLGEGVGSQFPNIAATTLATLATGGIGGGIVAGGLDVTQETGGYMKELEQKGALPSEVTSKSLQFFTNYAATSSPIEALTSALLLKGGKNLVTKLAAGVVGEGAQGGLGEAYKQMAEGVSFRDALSSDKTANAALQEAKAALPMEMIFAAVGLKLNRKAPSAAAQHYANLTGLFGPERASEQLQNSFDSGVITEEELAKGKKAIEISKIALQDADNLGLEGGQKNLFVGLSAELNELEEKLDNTTTPAAKKVIEAKIKEKEGQIDEVINKPEVAVVIDTADLGKIAVHSEDAKELLQDEDFKEAVLDGTIEIKSDDVSIQKEVEKVLTPEVTPEVTPDVATEAEQTVPQEVPRETDYFETPIKQEDAGRKTVFNFKDPISGVEKELKGKISTVRLAMKKKIDTFDSIIKCLG